MSGHRLYRPALHCLQVRQGRWGSTATRWPTRDGVHVAADGGDASGELVAQDQRVVHDVVADPAVLVVMDVAAAHTDGGDLHQDLVRVQLRDGQCFHGHVALALEDGGAHGGGHFRMSGGAGLCG